LGPTSLSLLVVGFFNRLGERLAQGWDAI
jgi:hypothetical protein